MIERLCEFGFSGIVIHRKLFSTAEKAAELEGRLSTLLGCEIQESNDKDFSFLRLDDFCAAKGPPKRDLTAERIKLLSDTQRIGDIDFAKPNYPIFVAEVTGMSAAEPFGRWTDGSLARFRFKQTLPKRFTLEIMANAFGPNLGVPTKVRVNGVEKSFVVVDNGGRTYSLSFETDGTADTLEIIPPHPVSPGTGDTRKLGLALISLKIRR
jgi:phosphoglycerol transferase